MRCWRCILHLNTHTTVSCSVPQPPTGQTVKLFAKGLFLFAPRRAFRQDPDTAGKLKRRKRRHRVSAFHDAGAGGILGRLLDTPRLLGRLLDNAGVFGRDLDSFGLRSVRIQPENAPSVRILPGNAVCDWISPGNAVKRRHRVSAFHGAGAVGLLCEQLHDESSDARVVVGAAHGVGCALRLVLGIGHGHSGARRLDHRDVVDVVAECYGVCARYA